MTFYKINYNQQAIPKLLFFFFGMWSFLILCRPQEYITWLQVFRPSLVLSLITICLYILNISKTPALPSSKQVKLYVYLVITIMASIPFSYYRRHSFDEFMLYCNIILFFMLFIIIVNTALHLRRMIFAYCIGTSTFALFSMYNGNISSNNRLSFGSTFDPNDIAFFLISFLAFNFIFLDRKKGKLTRCFSVLSIIISSLAILKTGSRGGLVSLLALIIVLMLVNTNTLKVSFVKKAIICIIALLSLQSIDINTERYKTILSLKNDYNYSDETGRIAIWETGIYLMVRHPLTGVGFNCFNEGIGRERESRGLPPVWQAPHNSLIQIGTETGIVGLFLFLALSVNAYKIFKETAIKARNEDLNKIGEMARAGFIGHFISAMFLSQAYSAYWAFYIVLSAVLKCLLDNECRSCESVS